MHNRHRLSTCPALWQKRGRSLWDCARPQDMVDFRCSWERQMAWRGWISGVVMLGVLMHAIAVVRHNTVMLSAHLQHASLAADLHILCNPSGSGNIDSASLPDLPRPADAQNDCPICVGLAFAVMTPTPSTEPSYLVFDPPMLRPTAEAAPVGHRRILLPPVRGPPSLA